jgi:hypothetical protein
MNISRLIESNHYKKKFNYYQFNEKYELREELIKESKFDYMTKKGAIEIKISKDDSKNNLISDDSFDGKNNNEMKIMLCNRNNNNSLFSNNYDSINSSLKRFIFEGYDEKKNSSIEEYYNDLLKIFP